MNNIARVHHIPEILAGTAPELLAAHLTGKDPASSDYLNLLLFSVAGVSFGIDADQVSGVAAYNGETGKDLFWFHEELGYGGLPVTYYSPTVVSIRYEGEVPYRVIIDSMEDIAEFGHDEIKPFPALLEPLVLCRGIWGVLPANGRMILLLDFERLLREKYGKSTDKNLE